MRNLDDIQPESPQQGFPVPGLFEITAMGNAAADLARARTGAARRASACSVLDGSLRTRAVVAKAPICR